MCCDSRKQPRKSSRIRRVKFAVACRLMSSSHIPISVLELLKKMLGIEIREMLRCRERNATHVNPGSSVST